MSEGRSGKCYRCNIDEKWADNVPIIPFCREGKEPASQEHEEPVIDLFKVFKVLPLLIHDAVDVRRLNTAQALSQVEGVALKEGLAF